jgi:hypothetical protein
VRYTNAAHEIRDTANTMTFFRYTTDELHSVANQYASSNVVTELHPA